MGARPPRRAAPRPARHKLLSRPAVAQAVARARRRGERVVFTNGCFDLLHVDHLRSLEAARRLGDRLVVGVNSDASVRRLKGTRRPVVPARQRAELLAAIVGGAEVRGWGGRVVRLREVPGVRTTRLLERAARACARGTVEGAAPARRRRSAQAPGPR